MIPRRTTGPHRPTSHRPTSHRALTGILTFSLLLPLSLAACGRSTAATVATTTPSPATTPTLASSMVVPGPQLAWKQETAPQGAYGIVGNGISVAPSNGDVAYACGLPSAGSSAGRMFVSLDRAATWIRVTDVPTGKPDATFCSVTVDATDPASAIAIFAWPVSQKAIDPAMPQAGFVTFDGGAHWQTLDTKQFISLSPVTASANGRIYVMRANPASGVVSLWVTPDRFATWQPIDAGIPAPVQAFWLDPNSGALLTETNGAGTTSDQFYTSADGGGHWSQLPAPQLDNAKGQQQQWAVAAPRSGQPWQICAGYAAITVAHPNTLACSSDGGQTWATRPALNIVAHSPKGFDYYAPTFLLAIAADGAVLATAGGASADVYRLRAGESVWQDQGPLPLSLGGGVVYYPTSPGGVLWIATQPGPQVAAYPAS